MNYNKKSNYTFLKYDITEKRLPTRYTGGYTVSVREGTDLEKSSIENPEMISVAVLNGGENRLNPIFAFDRNAVHLGEGNYSKYVNAYGLELLYDVYFGYDGYAFEIIYQNPRDLQLWVDEGEGWQIVFDRYLVGHNEDKTVALKIAFGSECDGFSAKSYKMRRFRLRTTSWFGGIIRDKTCSVVKSIKPKAPLAVFEGSSITESCNAVSSFNAYSYARILSDIYGFQYLCLAQGGTGMAKPTDTRPSMLERIDGVLKAEPDILFMEVGINDKPDDNLKSDTENYLKKIREALPNTFMLMIGSYYPKYTPKAPKERCEKDKITSAACKEYGVPFIELTTGFVYGTDGEIIAEMGVPLITGTGTAFEPDFSGTSDRYTGRINVKDGCHCNPTTYRMFAEYIRSAFNAIINSLD